MESKNILITKNVYNDNVERTLNCYELDYVGIGNRLKQLFSNMHLHEGEFDTLNIFWPIKTHVQTPFKQLFDFTKFERVNEINYSIYLDFRYYEEGTWQLLLKPDERKVILDAGLDKIDFQYEKIPSSITEIYKPYFSSLKPTKEVQKLIDKIQMPENCISVHIRHMSDWKHWNRWNDNDINLFIQEMRKYGKDAIFYIACQCEEVKNIILNEFKDQTISLPRDYTKMNNIQDVADLYLLSKNKKLIGTYGSTFTECIWWLSGCTQEVTIIGSESGWENNGNPYHK